MLFNTLDNKLTIYKTKMSYTYNCASKLSPVKSERKSNRRSQCSTLIGYERLSPLVSNKCQKRIDDLHACNNDTSACSVTTNSRLTCTTVIGEYDVCECTQQNGVVIEGFDHSNTNARVLNYTTEIYIDNEGL